MELFGLPIEDVYLYTFIIFGCISFLYILFGDILDGIFDFGIFNPVLFFSFMTFFAAEGFIFEKVSSLASWGILIISAGSALVLVLVLNIFVIIPVKSAESSLTYKSDDLRGRIGRVIISIPEQGFGEVVIKSNSGTISKPAVSFEGDPIEYGQDVLIIDIKNGVLYVAEHQSFELEL